MRSRQPLGIEHALLGLLEKGPRHGYDLYQELSRPDGMAAVWRLKQAHLYAILARLEQDGYMTASLEAQEPRPPRKVYDLTAEGRSAFQEWMETPLPRGRQLRNEFLAKLYFAEGEGQETVRRLVAAQRRACAGWDEAKPAMGQEPSTFLGLVGSYRASQVHAIIVWLEACELALDPGSAQG